MNNKDREVLALQFARRRIKEGVNNADAVIIAQVRYGLTTASVKRIISSLKAEAAA